MKGQKLQKRSSEGLGPNESDAAQRGCSGDWLPDLVESRKWTIIFSITLMLAFILAWILPSGGNNNNHSIQTRQPAYNHHGNSQSHVDQQHHIHETHGTSHSLALDKRKGSKETHNMHSEHVHEYGSVASSLHDHSQHLSLNEEDPLKSLLFEPLNPDAIQHILRVYKGEVLATTMGQLLHINTSLYESKFSSNPTSSKQSVQLQIYETKPCEVKNNATNHSLSILAEIAVNPIVNSIEKLYPDDFKDFSVRFHEANPFTASKETMWSGPLISSDLANEIIEHMKGSASLQSYVAPTSILAPMLIVFTTCDQLAMTILSLQYLKLHLRNSNTQQSSRSIADLLIIDDHSVDGTVEYLRKRGFAVITKPEARGLTDSWNIGYRMAIALGYENVLFTNNDVLLTTGSLELMGQALHEYPLVLPTTTERGAGHNPWQVSGDHFGIKFNFLNFSLYLVYQQSS